METPPPLAPLRPFTPAKTASSPTQQRPGSASSFSSIHSGGQRHSIYSNRRFSNASRLSNGFEEALSPLEARRKSIGGGGMGTLADELDFDDDDEWDQDNTLLAEEEDDGSKPESSGHRVDQLPTTTSPVKPSMSDGARDSGIDVSAYHKGPRRRQSEHGAHNEIPQKEDDYSRELEIAMKDIADLAQASTLPQADTTARTLAALRDLPSQASLETLTHRLNTSTSSISSAMLAQTRALQSLMSSVFSPLLSFVPFDADDIDDILTFTANLLRSLPLLPDPSLVSHFSKLNRDTTELQTMLSSVLDSLQLGKQLSTGAARHIKITNTMVTELRREQTQAEESSFYLEREDWNSKLSQRWCAQQCRDVVGGFEQYADGLRAELESKA